MVKLMPFQLALYDVLLKIKKGIYGLERMVEAPILLILVKNQAIAFLPIIPKSMG
jgi:hypothetical protein